MNASIDNEPGTADLVSQGPTTGVFNPAAPDAGVFTFDAAGRTTDGVAVIVHLEGRVTNRPPVAKPGADQIVECGQGGVITLDERGSNDPDPGDTIAHYQWFQRFDSPSPAGEDEETEFEVGVGTTATIAIPPGPVGEREYWLHVYDGHLASHAAPIMVRTVDTTAPVISLAASSVCVWPPNHKFVRLQLATDLLRGVADACDPNPTAVILDAGSSEPATVVGSGNTTLDVVFGPTTVCLRAERSGTGPGRHYTVVVQATDHSMNSSTQALDVFVPHDLSGLPANCLRGAPLDELDASCAR